MSIKDRLREADPFMAVRWEQMRVDYWTQHKRGNEKKLEDAHFQLDRWNLILKQRLGDHVSFD